jgi:alkaline phosphatase
VSCAIPTLQDKVELSKLITFFHILLSIRDAFAFAPTKNIQKAINDGTGCSFCGKLFSTKAQSLVVPCVAHDHLPSQGARKTAASSTRKVSASAPAAAAAKNVVKKEKETTENGQAEQEEDSSKPKKPTCNAKFCNKLCRERGKVTF